MNLTSASPTVEELLRISVFADIEQHEQLQWLADQMQRIDLNAGDIFINAGDPAEHLFLLFDGEMHSERADGRVYVMSAGAVTGLLPYSRLTQYPSSVRAVVESHGAALHKDKFPEMLTRLPVLQQRLVSVLADRIRESSAAEQQREKLLALGKISAGLAHELNNPAAAAQRAASSLRQAVDAVRRAALRLDKRGLPAESRVYLAHLDLEWIKAAGAHATLDSLERSDREEEFATWLEQHGVPNAFEFAASLVDAGCDRRTLEEIAQNVPAEFLADVFTRMTASFTISRLIEEIDSSISKISELVRAVKEYSYMDQMPEQEIDIHAGLENTLLMLRHRLKAGVDVVREYDRAMPPVCAHGSELNQVWTNLITNAIDAMNGSGKLCIRTVRDSLFAIVEIVDNGPGIPDEIRSRIFEPFFTTKPVGEGTGLGLDVVYRIVRAHRGSVTFASRPGETRFTVRIPFSKRGEAPAA